MIIIIIVTVIPIVVWEAWWRHWPASAWAQQTAVSR